jgi:hypothetical protein
MKRKVIFLILLLAGSVCFAQESVEYGQVNSLLISGLNKNFDRIQNIAAQLNEAERIRLYNIHIMKSDEMWIGAVLDFFVGFGIGNFYQQDYLGGGITLGGDIIGLGLLIAGYGLSLDAISTGSLSQIFDVGLPLYVAGGLVISVANIFGLVRTFTFPSSYNNKLRSALNVGGLVLNIEPSLDITAQGYELALVRIKL